MYLFEAPIPAALQEFFVNPVDFFQSKINDLGEGIIFISLWERDALRIRIKWVKFTNECEQMW